MSSPLLSRLRLVTVDVTGTLITYRGQLGDYYCMAAKHAGMPCPDYGRVHEGFKLAYADMGRGRSGTSGCSRAGVVGVEKPDPRIYEVALRQAGGGGGGGGVAPGEALHIGDSLRKNYARPRAEPRCEDPRLW
ncbi:Haloacid dehalogenase-like hydrolase (HAD) superfamily protein [Zea mays]|uniref:Haloacid dehalogenase-like hydrolase (HAD) superfamily protein n=1 Tax=Zea mays TaxID=4577 RepID=A0A1D6QS76_MAIZE|nr:Haloacid dehalogenase-like hydrolase (HAD) superfamily protein [Zea mays]